MSPFPTIREAPRGANTLQHIFHDHFPAFADADDSLYAKHFGKFRLERISQVPIMLRVT
jgi:hypothetical protein